MHTLQRCAVMFFCLYPLLEISGEGAESVDVEKEKGELLKVHQEDRRSHLERDVDLLSSRSPDVFISVTRGKIDRITKEQERKFFTSYFKGAKYYAWDDLESPIIHVSRDGTMGWMIVRLKVRRVQTDEAGKEVEQAFVYAGIMTYEKRGGRWIRIANVSTFE